MSDTYRTVKTAINTCEQYRARRTAICDDMPLELIAAKLGVSKTTVWRAVNIIRFQTKQPMPENGEYFFGWNPVRDSLFEAAVWALKRRNSLMPWPPTIWQSYGRSD